MKRFSTILLVLMAVAFLSGATARAVPFLEATLTEYTGDEAIMSLTIEELVSGDLKFSLEVTELLGGEIVSADITGFFAHISNESLLPGLSVTGDDVVEQVFDANNVSKLDNGVVTTGGGSENPGEFDFGVRFSKPGDGTQLSTMFTLMHDTVDLTLDLFENQLFAARLQAIGERDDVIGIDMEGSSKLKGTSGEGEPGDEPGDEPGAVPEVSSTLLLLGLAVTGLESYRRKSKK